MNGSTMRSVLPVIAVVVLVTGGCMATGSGTAYYARAFYGAGPWGRYYYRPAFPPGGAGPASSDISPAYSPPDSLPSLPGSTAQLARLPEPPTGVPDMGMPNLRPGEHAPEKPGGGAPDS